MSDIWTRTVLLMTLSMASLQQAQADTSRIATNPPAGECSLALTDVKIGGLTLGQTEREFMQQHPKAVKTVLPIDNTQFEIKTNDGLDDALRSSGVTRIGHIGFNPTAKRISSFSLGFLDSAYATYETDLDVFKTRIINAFHLPNGANDWQLNGNHYQYRCQDYLIEIIQDYGAEHTAIGPTVMAFSRYSPHWEMIFNDSAITEPKMTSKSDANVSKPTKTAVK